MDCNTNCVRVRTHWIGAAGHCNGGRITHTKKKRDGTLSLFDLRAFFFLFAQTRFFAFYHASLAALIFSLAVTCIPSLFLAAYCLQDRRTRLIPPAPVRPSLSFCFASLSLLLFFFFSLSPSKLFDIPPNSIPEP